MKKVIREIISWGIFFGIMIFFFNYTFDDNGRIVKFRLKQEDVSHYKEGLYCNKGSYYNKEDDRTYTEVNETKQSFVYVYEIHYDDGNSCNKIPVDKENIGKYKVTFDTKGGNDIDPLYFNDGETLKKLPVPELNGFKFIRWEDKFMTPIYEGALIDGDITLYAYWEKID